MDHTQPQPSPLPSLRRYTGSGATPFSQQTVVLTKQAYIELKWQANYWRAQHERLVEREAALKAEVEALQATIRDLNQRLYGAKSEKSACPDRAGESKPANPRKRGQQPGSTGHGRSDRTALPVVTEVHDLSEAAQTLPGLWGGVRAVSRGRIIRLSKSRSRPTFDASNARVTKRRANARRSQVL